MKFKIFLFALMFAFVNMLSAGVPKKAKPVTYKIDSKQTVLLWEGKKVTGKHAGNVTVKMGSISVTDGVLSAGNFVVDMNSIQCTDLKAGQGKENLEGHLKSDDFFGVANFPTAEFIATKIERVNGANYNISGDLTIKGKTHPVTFPAKVQVTKKMVKASGKIMIDRTKYDIKYGSGSFFENLGDKAIDNNFTMDINFVAVK